MLLFALSEISPTSLESSAYEASCSLSKLAPFSRLNQTERNQAKPASERCFHIHSLEEKIEGKQRVRGLATKFVIIKNQEIVFCSKKVLFKV